MSYSLSKIGYLSKEKVDEMISQKSAGVYVLDRIREGGFHINYVGRSDDDVNERLKKWFGSKYKWFRFDYASSPKNAFEKECIIYHDNGGPEGKLDNEQHPDRPANANWQCPSCHIFK